MQVVLAGPGIDLAVTAPAATLALTLMFLRTDDPTAAAHFALPSSRAELAATRPDLLLLRVTGRALVMWTEMRAELEWVEAQIPQLAKVNTGQ
jgi:anaphase-promoting complex subunit 1